MKDLINSDIDEVFFDVDEFADEAECEGEKFNGILNAIFADGGGVITKMITFLTKTKNAKSCLKKIITINGDSFFVADIDDPPQTTLSKSENDLSIMILEKR